MRFISLPSIRNGNGAFPWSQTDRRKTTQMQFDRPQSFPRSALFPARQVPCPDCVNQAFFLSIYNQLPRLINSSFEIFYHLSLILNIYCHKYSFDQCMCRLSQRSSNWIKLLFYSLTPPARYCHMHLPSILLFAPLSYVCISTGATPSQTCWILSNPNLLFCLPETNMLSFHYFQILPYLQTFHFLQCLMRTFFAPVS